MSVGQTNNVEIDNMIKIKSKLLEDPTPGGALQHSLDQNLGNLALGGLQGTLEELLYLPSYAERTTPIYLFR